MNEEDMKEMYKKALDLIHGLEKEVEVLASSHKITREETDSLALQVAKYEGKSQIIAKEVELDSYFSSRTTTRELARQAITNSTAEANWKSLEEHPTILNIYQSIKDRRNEQEVRIEEVLRRFETSHTYREMLEQIKDTDIIQEIKEGMHTFDTSLGLLRTSLDNDRTHANQQDLKIRDQIADMQTAQDMLEFLQSELGVTFHAAFMFVVGAFAGLGYEPIEKGLREILKKPKEEPKDNEATETPSGS